MGDSRPVSPSRATAPVDYQPGELLDSRFCSYRFVNKEAHLYWLTGWKMSFNINAERSFPPDHNHMPTELLALTSNQTQFGSLLMGFQFKASSSITREIYINLMKTDFGSNDWVYCRRRWIEITPETIRTTLNLPPLVDVCAYTTLKDNPSPHLFQKLLGTLCPNVPGAHWVGDKLPITYLIRPARWMAEFVHNRILGIKHLTVMDYDAVLVIFCLLKGFPVDIPKIICGYFRERKNDGAMKGFGLAGLLTQMATDSHVDIPSHLRDLRLPAKREYRRVQCGFEKHARYIPHVVEALPPAAANSTSNEREHATDFEQDPPVSHDSPVQQAHDQMSQSMSERIPQDQTMGGSSRPGGHSSAGDGERPNLSGKAGRHSPAEQMDRPRAGQAAGRRSPEPKFSTLSPFEQWATRKIAKQSQELELLRKYVKGMARGMEKFFRMEKHGQRAIAKMGRGLEQGLKEVHKVVKKGKGKGLEFPQRYSSSNCPSWQMEVSRPLDSMSVDDDYWTADGSVAQDHNPRPMASTRSPDRVNSQHTEVLISDHTEILPDSPQDSTARFFPAREQAVVSSGYRAESSSGRIAMQQPSSSGGQQAGPSRERGHAASGHGRNTIVLSDSSDNETTTMSTSSSRHERDSDYQPYRFG